MKLPYMHTLQGTHTVGGIKMVMLPFRSVPFRLNGNGYHFRADENGEQRSMK